MLSLSSGSSHSIGESGVYTVLPSHGQKCLTEPRKGHKCTLCFQRLASRFANETCIDFVDSCGACLTRGLVSRSTLAIEGLAVV